MAEVSNLRGLADLSLDDYQRGLSDFTALYISGDVAHSTSYGPDSSGVSTVRAVLQGGKIVILVDAAELMAFHGTQSLQTALQLFTAMGSAEVPNAFTLPSLSARTGDELFVPFGYIGVEKTLHEDSVSLRTHFIAVL